MVTEYILLGIRTKVAITKGKDKSLVSQLEGSGIWGAGSWSREWFRVQGVGDY